MDSNVDAALCPVCYGVYDDPRSLPCGHSFCLKCISKVADLRRNFPCPSCRQDVKLDYKGVNGLPKNYGLNNIIEGNIKMSPALCSGHAKSLEIFCEQCDVMICSKCLFGLHAGHTILEMDDVFNNRKIRLTEVLEGTKQLQAKIQTQTEEIRSSRQSVQKDAETIKAKIDDTFKRWSDDQEKQRQIIQRHVDNETKQRLKIFDGRLTDLHEANTAISSSQTEMNTTLSKDKTSVIQKSIFFKQKMKICFAKEFSVNMCERRHQESIISNKSVNINCYAKLYGSMEQSYTNVWMITEQTMQAYFAPPPDLKIEISAPWMEEAIQNINPFDTAQGEITPVARGISIILEENQSLQRVVQILQDEKDEYKSTNEFTKRRNKETLEQLKHEQRKNKELTYELEKEKRDHQLRNAELTKNLEEVMCKILQTSDSLKKPLDDTANSLLSMGTSGLETITSSSRQIDHEETILESKSSPYTRVHYES